VLEGTKIHESRPVEDEGAEKAAESEVIE